MLSPRITAKRVVAVAGFVLLTGFLFGGLITVISGSAVAATESENSFHQVDLTLLNDSDNDDQAAAFQLTIEADTTLNDTDVGFDSTGEPYIEVEVDGETVQQTEILPRNPSYRTEIRVSQQQLQSFSSGSHEVSIQLWDADDGQDAPEEDLIGDDDKLDEVERGFGYEPPEHLGIEVSRETTIVGSPVVVRETGNYDAPLSWTVVEKPSNSSAQVRRQQGSTATVRPDARGEYEIRIESRTKPETFAATATVNVTQRAQIDRLRRYAPRLHYREGTTYLPTRYEAFVNHAQLEDIASFDDPAPTMFDLAGKSGRWELDLNGSEAVYPTYDDRHPVSVYGSVHEDVEFRGSAYTAYTYWLFYIHDPKQGGLSELLAHESDLETVTILVNESGPQWTAASQHYGGELREWSKTPKTDQHPHLYPAIGAHSNYLRDTERYRGGIPVLDQFIQQPRGTAQPVEVTDSGALVRDAYQDRTGAAKTVGPSEYEIVPLTGREVWATYDGTFGADDDLGQIPMERERWTAPGAWIESVPLPDEQQIDAAISESKYTSSDGQVTASVTVENTGSKPHPFSVSVEAKRTNESWAEARTLTTETIPVGARYERSLDVNATAPNASGSWDVRTRLLAYSPAVSTAEDLLDTSVAADPVRISASNESATPTATPAPTATPTPTASGPASSTPASALSAQTTVRTTPATSQAQIAATTASTPSRSNLRPETQRAATTTAMPSTR